MISWSIVASCQSKINSRTTFWLTRGLMVGLYGRILCRMHANGSQSALEGGFIPDVILYLSYFYTSNELPIRLSFFWVAYAATYIASAFLAYGILHLRRVNGLTGWQWLFALEGSVTAFIGLVSLYVLIK